MSNGPSLDQTRRKTTVKTSVASGSSTGGADTARGRTEASAAAPEAAVDRRTEPALCRICTSYCPILVEVVGGQAVKVTGDPEAPLYEGYTCPKGRALPEQHNGPSRLLRCLKRQPDGRHTAIASQRAMDEIAAKVGELISRHGPRSVALYMGTGAVSFWPVAGIAAGWMQAIGSPMFFTANTIDKPGAQIAQAAHGTWLAGHPPFETAEAWLLVGVNPLISKSGGFPPNNPGRRLKEAVNERGLKLIVVDPRKTETARRAYIHLQCRPGEDPAIIACLLNVILSEKLHDDDFVFRHAANLDALSAHVAAFSPEYVSRRADVPAELLVEAARTLACARYAGGGCGTGPSFATHGSLTEYLVSCLSTVCGHWSREGDRVTKPGILLPAYQPKAQPLPPFALSGGGERMRSRDLEYNASGMPTAALSDEILWKGEDRVRALFCLAGNPIMAWPDQVRAFEALSSLELLVTSEIEMTDTARLSHYVMASKLTLETPSTSVLVEALRYYGHSRGIEGPYARYAPRIVEPPADSDVIEDWQLYYGLARRLGRPLSMISAFGMGEHLEAPVDIVPLDMETEPSSEALVAMSVRRSRVPLDEVKRHPHGHLFDEAEVIVAPADADCADRLDLGNATMMAELAMVRVEPAIQERISDSFPLLLIPRRANRFMNSHGRQNAKLVAGLPHNPAYLNPADLQSLGLASGDLATIESAHGAIHAVVDADDSLRLGVVSITHGFGTAPVGAEDPRAQGCNVGRLLRSDLEFDPITGIPRMGAVPVRVTGTWNRRL